MSTQHDDPQPERGKPRPTGDAVLLGADRMLLTLALCNYGMRAWGLEAASALTSAEDCVSVWETLPANAREALALYTDHVRSLQGGEG